MALQFLEKVKSDDDGFDVSVFYDQEIIKETDEILTFFSEHKLCHDAQKRKADFDSWKIQIRNLAQNAKNFKKLNQIEQLLYLTMENIQIMSPEGKYDAMVAELFSLQSFTDQIKNTKSKSEKIDDKAHRDLILIGVEQFKVDLITNMSKDLSKLFEFAFAMRKQDIHDELSFDLLNGTVNPSILVDIIMNNKYDLD